MFTQLIMQLLKRFVVNILHKDRINMQTIYGNMIKFCVNYYKPK